LLRAAGLIYEVGVVRTSGLNQYEHDWRAHRHILPSIFPTRTTCVWKRSVKLSDNEVHLRQLSRRAASNWRATTALARPRYVNPATLARRLALN